MRRILPAAALLVLAALPALSGGCGGNVLVPASDGGPPEEMATCSGPGTCSLVAKTCCGNPCGQPTLADEVAVTKGKEEAHRQWVCGPSPEPCPAYGCPGALPEPSLMALCRGTTPRCEAVDLRAEPVSACATDADCVLQYPSCCQPCEANPYELVALSRTQLDAFRKYVCVGTEVCSRCATPPAAGWAARCDPATKHCLVKRPTGA